MNFINMNILPGSNWKKKTRDYLFNWLPVDFYLKILPVYFKLFNRRRRQCKYRFELKNNKIEILEKEKSIFFFLDYRRINRYFFPAGLNIIMSSMMNKYCSGLCVIDENDIVVEVGANIGEFTLPAAQLAQKLYAFEPDPNCYDCLLANIKNLNNVEVLKYGVSDTSGLKKYFLSTEDADSSFVRPKYYTETLEVQAIRLDEWMVEKGLSRIDYLKIDAEGGELEVLQGLGNMIANVNKISVDGGPERHGKPTNEIVANYLLDYGFNISKFGYQVYAWK